MDSFSDMGGLCPGNAGPPGCYAGSKWTPNDPVFFPAVRDFHFSMAPPNANSRRLLMGRWSASSGTIGRTDFQ